MSLHAPLRSSFVTSDPDQAVAHLAAAYAELRLTVLGAEPFRLEHRRLDLGGLGFNGFRSTSTTQFEVDPIGGVVVARVLQGIVESASAGRDRRVGAGDVFIPATPEQSQVSRSIGARVDLTVVGLPVLLATDPERAPELLRSLRLDPLDAAAGRRWRHSLQFVTQVLTGDEHDAVGPLVLGSTGRLLASTLLETFAPPVDDLARDSRDAAPAVVRRATAFIDANLDLDIGPADIARAAHVGVRALQLAFRRHLDTTPTAYLRQARLAMAHADLLDADPGDGTTVTVVAARWGFSNATRFGVFYRTTYGCSPVITLRSWRDQPGRGPLAEPVAGGQAVPPVPEVPSVPPVAAPPTLGATTTA